jgi:hypothetical protein
MRSIRWVALVIVVWLPVGSTVFADVQLSIQDGRISIVAKDATVSQILTEWATVGQTKIVNGAKIPRDPMTIELQNVSEEEALEVVLRTASGYLAAPRAVAVPNASRFDRIVVMPPSVVAPPPPSPAAASAAARVTNVSAAPAYPAPIAAPAYQSPEYPQQPPPVVATEPAYDNANDVTGSDEEPNVMVVGAPVVPTAAARAQISFRARQALETVDPRTFQLPKQPQGPAGLPPAGMQPRGVAFPGMIVQPPAQPRQPGQPPSGGD